MKRVRFVAAVALLSALGTAGFFTGAVCIVTWTLPEPFLYPWIRMFIVVGAVLGACCGYEISADD